MSDGHRSCMQIACRQLRQKVITHEVQKRSFAASGITAFPFGEETPDTMLPERRKGAAVMTGGVVPVRDRIS